MVIRDYRKGRKYVTITFYDVIDARDANCYDTMVCRITIDAYNTMITMPESRQAEFIAHHLV